MEKPAKHPRKTSASLCAPNPAPASIASSANRIRGSRQIQHFSRLSRTTSPDYPGQGNKGNGLAWPNQHTSSVWRNRTLGLVVVGSRRSRGHGDAPQHWILAFAGMRSWTWRAHYWLHLTEIRLDGGLNEYRECRTVTFKILLRSLTT